MKAIKLPTFHRVSKENATEASPAGTIKFHYALEGTKEELQAYEESRGTYFRTVSEGTHKDKPLWMTSQILPDEVNVTLNKAGYLAVQESIEDATAKAQERVNSIIADKQLEKKMQMAAKYGLTVSL